MKVTTTYQNLSRGQVDHDLQGRFDIPLYNTGADVCSEFITNFKGNAIYRSGFENMLEFQDCAFIEFKFSISQNYILVLYNTKMRFLSYDGSGNFGWVLSGGLPLEVTTPYSLAESKEIALSKSYTQNSDVMIIVHQDHEPRRLTRTSATAFTLTKYSRKNDPFPTTTEATKTITNITQASSGVITAVAHGYSIGDRIQIGAVVGMTEINNWTVAITSVPTADTFGIDLDTTDFTAYSSAGNANRVSASDNPRTVLFYKGRLYYAATTLKPTTLYGSESGEYYIHTLPTTIVDTSAFQVTIADIAQHIEWLFAGENSLIAGAADGIVAINGGGVNTAIKADTIEANVTSADGASSVQPLSKDGLIFYCGINGRNLYYFQYDILTESFLSQDSNIFSYEITKGIFKKIRYIKDRNNLIFALLEDGTLLTLNFYEKENILGWHTHTTEGLFKDIATITDNDGVPQLFALTLRNNVYYIEKQAKYVEFHKRADFYTSDESADDEAYYRYIAEQLNECIYLDNASTLSNLKTTTITYSSGAGTITASAASFVAGDVGKHITYKTATGYESGRFLITGYTSTTVVSVDVLQTPTANSYASWYLSFLTITGLARFNGLEVSVVADGGYLADYTVSGGEITLTSQTNFATVGYKYRGVIKTFCLGFSVQGHNTQTTMKSISRVGVRTVASAGGQVGSSPYRLEDIQELTPDDLNYLPALPMDGTKYITYTDDNKIDKYLYIIQDTPAPFHLNCIMLEANYS